MPTMMTAQKLINKQKEPISYERKTCTFCGTARPLTDYIKCHTILCPDGLSTICNECIADYLESKNYDWDTLDRLCQTLNIPWIPKEFEKYKECGRSSFPRYCALMGEERYSQFFWKDYWEDYQELHRMGRLQDELPLLGDKRRASLRQKWGENYDDQALNYLEDLHSGMLATQQINGKLSSDQALKLCKISYEIDCRIRAGDDFDKLLSSYDKLVKIAEFTPQNTKNAADFDSCGELIRWLERGGWKNKFFDGVTRDIVDATIQNIQSYNQRLYTNETGIGDIISDRIKNLQNSKALEDTYDLNKTYDLDNFENDGFDELFNDSFKENVDEN